MRDFAVGSVCPCWVWGHPHRPLMSVVLLSFYRSPTCSIGRSRRRSIRQRLYVTVLGTGEVEVTRVAIISFSTFSVRGSDGAIMEAKCHNNTGREPEHDWNGAEHQKGWGQRAGAFMRRLCFRHQSVMSRQRAWLDSMWIFRCQKMLM